ncbi:unnamed protein product [Cuscuta campestris]|uniref:RNA helicase n=1 Tax=Cuscuta campestris TaxID=132261 RepID=A0A484MLJ8_9ASTE|nr:unnamed protein product [Cuscuta campestris]
MKGYLQLGWAQSLYIDGYSQPLVLHLQRTRQSEREDQLEPASCAQGMANSSLLGPILFIQISHQLRQKWRQHTKEYAEVYLFLNCPVNLYIDSKSCANNLTNFSNNDFFTSMTREMINRSGGRVNHIFREANTAAHHLAQHALQENNFSNFYSLVSLPKRSRGSIACDDALNRSNFDSYSARARDSLACWSPDSVGFNLIEAVLCHICRKQRPGAVLVFMTGWEDISCLRDQLKAHPLLGDPNRVFVLPCHGSMATSEQKLIFERPLQNVRKIVLAKNMAEASITINDIVFVVDCGKAKETSYDALNNTPCLLPSWISQASARQRRGRAGRVQPGECYHLYPRCVYEAFAEYQLPELLRTPLNSLCLQIKSLQVGIIAEFLSAALQSPEPLAVQNAIEFLKMIGALDEHKNLTHLGIHDQ